MRPRHPRWTQPLALCAAFGAWGLLGLPTLSALVWTYLGVWLVLAGARAAGVRGTELRWPPGLALAVAAVLLLPALALVTQHGAEIVDNEQVQGLSGVLEDRAQNRRPIRMHPMVLRGDRPQVFWIGAPHDSQVHLRINEEQAPIRATSLGHDLHRLRYDPAAHGLPRVQGRRARLTLLIDGEPLAQSPTWVPPRARPQALSPVPGTDAALAVSDETDELLWFGGPDHVRRWPMADGPVSAVATSSRSAFVAHRYAPYVLGVDLETGAITSTTPLPLAQTGIAAHAGWIAVPTEDPAAVWLWQPGQQHSKIALPSVPEQLCFGADAQTLVVSSRRDRNLMRVLRVGDGWSVETLDLGRPATALACDPQRPSVHVTVSDFRPPDDTGSNHAIEETIITVNTSQWVAWHGVTTESLGTTGAFGAAALLMQDGLLTAAFEGNDRLYLRGSEDLVRSPLPAPNGFVRRKDGTFIVTSAAEGAVLWLAADAQSVLAQVSLRSPDAASAVLSRGERNFAEATRSGASCASCHPGRDSDHAFHDIGHGQPRPTLSIRGLAGTSPFLRGASYPDLRGLNDFADSILGGYRRDTPDRADDLRAYIFSLPPPDAPARQTSASQDSLRLGLDSFMRAGCAECHAGPAFTDLAQYPSVMLFPDHSARVLLDTPSLLGVSTSPPYLFDGRARTLRSVFETHNPQRRHGAFHELSKQQQDGLLDFLERL